MAEAKAGDTVAVHYTGTLDDGTVFDSSKERAPLSFTVGSGQLIRGFDSAVVGMSVGETRTVKIAAEDAYGDHDERLVHAVERSAFPPDVELEVGRALVVKGPNGQPLRLTIVEIEDDEITLDGNHPLAGENLTFEISLVTIE